MAAHKKNEGFFSGEGGAELYFHSYMPKKPKGILAVTHGLGEHSGRYQFLIDYFLPLNWGIHLFDHRGHGKSPGVRTHTPSFSSLTEDLGLFLKKVRGQSEGLPLFLIAHSFGGQVAVNYLANRPIPMNGAVISSPNLKLVLAVPWIKKFVARRLSFVLPTLSLGSDIDASFVSRDVKVVEKYRDDPLLSRRMTLRMGAEILGNLERIMALAPKIKVPSLFLHGSADKITSCEGTQEFFMAMKAPHRELKVYPGYYHELFNETGKERVFADMEKWMEARIA